MSNEFKEHLKIIEIKDDVIWLQVNHGDSTGFKIPLAQLLRDYLDDKHGEPNDETIGDIAFDKLAISKAFDKELLRA